MLEFYNKSRLESLSETPLITKKTKVYPWLNRGGISTKPSHKVHFQDELSHTSASSGDNNADFWMDLSSDVDNHRKIAH